MKKFFSPNIGTLGRTIRAVGGGLLIIGGLIGGRYSPWICVVLTISGGFMLYEAARGWCVMRACGIKTKL